jgi:hypothetical protein
VGLGSSSGSGSRVGSALSITSWSIGLGAPTRPSRPEKKLPKSPKLNVNVDAANLSLSTFAGSLTDAAFNLMAHPHTAREISVRRGESRSRASTMATEVSCFASERKYVLCCTPDGGGESSPEPWNGRSKAAVTASAMGAPAPEASHLAVSHDCSLFGASSAEAVVQAAAARCWQCS